jgi:negative regulator of flagellin synthesis FlgM
MSSHLHRLTLESEHTMTDPISNSRPVVSTGQSSRVNTDKSTSKTDSASQVNDNLASNPVDLPPPAPASDQVQLSNVLQKAQNAPDFDQAKVDSIKKAIKDGQYPLDPKRIAESFNSLERLIRG